VADSGTAVYAAAVLHRSASFGLFNLSLLLAGEQSGPRRTFWRV